MATAFQGFTSRKSRKGAEIRGHLRYLAKICTHGGLITTLGNQQRKERNWLCSPGPCGKRTPRGKEKF